MFGDIPQISGNVTGFLVLDVGVVFLLGNILNFAINFQVFVEVSSQGFCQTVWKYTAVGAHFTI